MCGIRTRREKRVALATECEDKMYKKYMTLLFLCNAVILLTFFNVKGVQLNRVMASQAFQLRMQMPENEEGRDYMGILTQAASGQRIVDYALLEREYIYEVSAEDYEALLRIVEAEAGCEDEMGKLLVANVVLNRVNSEHFPDTIEEVIMQRDKGTTQFSPVANGRFYTVTISEETYDVVNRALCGEDVSRGALYFAARKYADPDKMKWFDNHLTFLFEHGGHEFFL